MEGSVPQCDWRSLDFRNKCVRQAESIMRIFPNHQLSIPNLEAKIFSESNLKEEYLNLWRTIMLEFSKTPSAKQTGGSAGMMDQQPQLPQGTYQAEEPPMPETLSIKNSFQDELHHIGAMMINLGGQMEQLAMGAEQGTDGPVQQRGTSGTQGPMQMGGSPS